jgi:hypothetical protein
MSQCLLHEDFYCDGDVQLWLELSDMSAPIEQSAPVKPCLSFLSKFLFYKNLFHHKVWLPELARSLSIISSSWRSRNSRMKWAKIMHSSQ